ncbi:glycogen/starch/alpha-glucan phosphorylase [Ructibacterium gallinarum]|uniref:glycogen/starch/alpha-glucan phosphorylase n=1 Tax=Ructibacterium gallinarum TaxID=2779355 RepID=UPI0021F547F5|nr:glycogen/starch/alpha-glucan phosphorylase [Ructibacterium gallinarum]
MKKNTSKAAYQERKAFIKDEITGKLKRYFGKTVKQATQREIYTAVSMTIRDEIMEKWVAYKEKTDKKPQKELYYLSFEFLMGRAMGNNLMNLTETDLYREVLADMGVSLEDVEEYETDAGLGNGGLGRLAACFLDSLTNLELPAFGCGIRYEYGLFRQKIVDGYQIEMPDPWLQSGNIWDIARPEDIKEIHFNGRVEEYMENGQLKFRHLDYNTVMAEPYDMPITGFESETVNTLRLWRAVSPEVIDMSEFNRGDYVKATENRALAEVISKILYPEDNHYEGKMLRLKQQYFFVSATMQWILSKHKQKELPLDRLPDYVQIHINDTHPTIAIPELMRLLMDEEGMGWDEAWGIVGRTFAYTNHTILCEALEKWPFEMVEHLLPRLAMIIREIDRRQREMLCDRFPGDYGKIEYMAVISQGQVSMANLCLTACHSINGVAALHTEILKKETFKDYYSIYPYKFKNMTNGVTFRRWLYKANPQLASLISQSIGDGWIKDYRQMEKLTPFAQDPAFRSRFAQIKHENKVHLAEFIKEKNGIEVDPDSMFDVQIKRLHEYKRQLLKILQIVCRYQQLLEHPEQADPQPVTYIFAAKAAPGYKMAKLIIKFINDVASVINSDSRVNKIMKVVFVENYSVSIAERIVAAADVSEQISTASKEASGTGNMKLMLNGALTLGTMDGANVEIREQVGDDNIFIFGLSSEEVLRIYAHGKSPSPEIYASNPVIKKAVDTLIDGTFNQENLFYEIYHSLVMGSGFADNYLILADFDSYLHACQQVLDKFKDKDAWFTSAVMNTAKSGFFSSDRTIEDYNREIWHLT